MQSEDLTIATCLGRDGGQVVSVLAFNSDNLSSNLADACSFSLQFVFEKTENKPKRCRGGTFKKNPIATRIFMTLHFVL